MRILPEWADYECDCSPQAETKGLASQYLGGGFGCRVVSIAVVEAIELAKRVKKPVKVLWTREEDLRYGYVRTPSFHRIRAAVDSSGG